MRCLMWFREDLRITDNPALFHAAQNSTLGVIGVYLIDTGMWQEHHMAACRVEFILRGLQALREHLKKFNIPLLVEYVENTKVLPAKLLSILHHTHTHAVFFNKQYEINELRRDQAVIQYLTSHQIACFSYDDQPILPPGSVLNQQASYFKVFTAYKRAWYRQFIEYRPQPLPTPKVQPSNPLDLSPIPTQLAAFSSSIDPKLWPAGEAAANKRLNYFINYQLENYHKERDFPALDGTSKLSSYLSAGMISARQCFFSAFTANGQELDTGNKGAITWMNEFIWRDFYKHLLVAIPRLSKGKAYQIATEQLPWQFNADYYHAWQQGQTGIPIVDAAMRQLNTTGWMHNRLRMITAMFLSKNLLFDWRLGERYFSQHLIDGDLAANNGGWQWSASTGTDAVPYFRIFNPISQSERFDPAGKFIRHYCPELTDFDDYAIHEPSKRLPLLAKQVAYPDPIVNLAKSRQQAIAVFKALKD